MYDMGDDWRHKLTFEKRMGDYDKNYALLLKAKGKMCIRDSLIGYVTNFVQFLALLKFWSLNCGKAE